MRRRHSACRMLPEVPGIPPKITEIISYLSFDFCNNKLLEREDLAQDLYLLYFKTMKEHKMAKKLKPGFFYILFKWECLNKWQDAVKRINREHKYKTERMALEGMACPPAEEKQDYVPEKKPKKKKVAGGKYGF